MDNKLLRFGPDSPVPRFLVGSLFGAEVMLVVISSNSNKVDVWLKELSIGWPWSTTGVELDIGNKLSEDESESSAVG